MAPTIGTLIAFRVVQGLGACAVKVIPRAVVRDLYTGPEAARLKVEYRRSIGIKYLDRAESPDGRARNVRFLGGVPHI